MNKIFCFTLLLASVCCYGAEWAPISESVTSQVKPGYAGPTAGVTVDRVSGDVYMVVSDQGLWKSTDHGQNFKRIDDKNIGGRCETGWALNFAPSGQRLFCFMIYGSTAMTPDAGATWLKSKSSHFDFGAVDWDDTGRRVLALRHESGGMLATSTDAGATWTDLEKGFSGLGVLDSKTFLATKTKEKGIFRSIDAGATWTKVYENTPAGAVPVLFQGVAYWCAGSSILVSKDKGASWSALPGDGQVNAVFGPYFGKSEKHFVVVGAKGFYETKDGGATWTLAAPLPPSFGVGRVGPNYAWDPNTDIFYASTMTKPTFKYERR